ncbi:MAG TPA: hypothetical protein PLF81_22420 [Candidatus Anammoximicrobium sp.]|nr:hypothetical protein [Candidatus Anammoximicrobium sp.]
MNDKHRPAPQRLTMPEILERIELIEAMARAKSNVARAMVRDGRPAAEWKRAFRDVGRCFRILYSLDQMGRQDCDVYERRLQFAADMAQR